MNLMPMNPNGNASTGFQTENEDGDVCMGGINGYPIANGMNGMNMINVNALGMDMGMGMEMGVDGFMYHQHQTQQQQQQQQGGW